LFVTRSLSAVVLLTGTWFAPASGQNPEYRSPAGVTYVSQPDTGGVARAESALAAAPREVARIIQLGLAQSAIRRYHEAIATFTRGIAIAPDSGMLYRWRGHRYLSVRQLDSARGELSSAGHLEVNVKGLVLLDGDPVPPALQGINPIPNFVAVVSCQTIMGGSPTVSNVATGQFPATMSGDSRIEANVTLPSPCFAPIVFVGLSATTWFAVTGE